MNTHLLCRVLLGATVLMLMLVFVSDGGDAAPPTTSGSGRAAAPPRPTVVFARGDAPRDLYVATERGTRYQIQRITITPADEVCPAWSPDGERIAFQSDRDDPEGDIYVMDRDGTDVVRLTSSPGFDWMPRWSPDGNHIVWVRCVVGFNIWMMNADGSNKHQLTYLPKADVMPDWAPDSQWIVWTSGRDGNPEIYKMNIDSTGLTRLTNTAAAEHAPAWSPNGLRIAYTRPSATGDPDDPWGPYHIWVMNSDGTGQTQLTGGAYPHYQPRWSSLGTHIMFSSFSDGSYDIYTMKADGSDVRKVISGPTDSWYHDWLILR